MAYCYEKKTDRKGNIYIEITGYEGSIRHLVIPRMIENIPVRSIGKYAFSGREDLCSLTLPETIDTLGRQAFYNCKKLRTIVVKTSKLTSRNIGSKAFAGTYAKAAIKVPVKQLNTYKKLFKSKGMGPKAVYKK